MNIRLIHTDKKELETLCRSGRVLEISRADEADTELMLYDPARNELTGIAPEISKHNSIPVNNCIWNSPDVYFATTERQTGHNQVIIYKFSPKSNEVSDILHFTADDLLDNSNKMLKIFVIAENQIIVQTEHKKDHNTEELMGNIEFTQTFYNISTNETNLVKDLNLINNGINCIIPVSPTHIMLKTGYPSIEDNRIDIDSESDALIESIYYGSISMFISTAFLDNSTISYKLLGTAYFDKGIISPQVSEDYIYFTIVDYKNNSSETFFYNFVLDETLRCLVEDARPDDLSRAYVINNIPYIRTEYNERTEFFNVLSSENDCVFYDEKFESVIGSLFIFSADGHVRIYQSPQMDLILEEKGIFVSACRDENDYFIYLSDK